MLYGIIILTCLSLLETIIVRIYKHPLPTDNIKKLLHGYLVIDYKINVNGH